jgi:hypothetical protein
MMFFLVCAIFLHYKGRNQLRRGFQPSADMRGYRDYDDELGPMKHSGLGIASFMLAIGAGVMLAILILLAVVIESSQPGAFDAETPTAIAVGCGFCLALLMAATGVALGIACVCQRNRNTIFGVIGLVLNGLIILGGGCLVLIGIASGPF